MSVRRNRRGSHPPEYQDLPLVCHRAVGLVRDIEPGRNIEDREYFVAHPCGFREAEDSGLR